MTSLLVGLAVLAVVLAFLGAIALAGGWTRAGLALLLLLHLLR